MSADDILLYRTLAAARGEGMPLPVSVTVNGRHETRVQVHVGDVGERQRWQEWWTRHDADGDWTTDEHTAGVHRHCFARGEWRGWRIELVHLEAIAEDGGETG